GTFQRWGCVQVQPGDAVVHLRQLLAVGRGAGDVARAVDRGGERIGLRIADAGGDVEADVAGGAGEHVVGHAGVVEQTGIGLERIGAEVGRGGLVVEQHRRGEHRLAVDRRQRGVVGLGVAHAGGDVGADVAERAAQGVLAGAGSVVAVTGGPVGQGGLVLVDHRRRFAGDVDGAGHEHFADHVDAVVHVPVAVDVGVVARRERGGRNRQQAGGNQGVAEFQGFSLLSWVVRMQRQGVPPGSWSTMALVEAFPTPAVWLTWTTPWLPRKASSAMNASRGRDVGWAPPEVVSPATPARAASSTPATSATAGLPSCPIAKRLACALPLPATWLTDSRPWLAENAPSRSCALAARSSAPAVGCCRACSPTSPVPPSAIAIAARLACALPVPAAWLTAIRPLAPAAACPSITARSSAAAGAARALSTSAAARVVVVARRVTARRFLPTRRP